MMVLSCETNKLINLDRVAIVVLYGTHLRFQENIDIDSPYYAERYATAIQAEDALKAIATGIRLKSALVSI